MFRVALEALIVIGIVNQCFFIALASDALEDYVLRSSDVELDTWRRLFIGFCLENVALAVYFAIRLWGSTRLASFMAEKSSETLRTVREAYQLGIRIREQRYQLMAINPATPLRQVCRFMGLDTPAADKYLAIVRFLDSLPAEERRAALLDNDLSISALTHRIELARRSLTWVDPGEAPTAAMLLKQLVPVVDLRQCYDLGKEFREAVWRAWNANSMRLISAPDLDPDQPRVVAAILQIAAFDIGITVRQGERYTKLCRFVEATPGNPYATLARMSKEYPSGILGFLEATASMSKQDAGDPLPSAIATVVEPIMLAKDAVDRGKALRRWMYEEWLTDMYLETDELLSRVVESKGSTVRACARYLLLLRYIEGLDPQRARAVLDVQRSSTLALWAQIKAMIDDGSWVDPGEPDFYEWTPPQNPPEWEKADFLSRVARGGGVSAVAGTARDTEASVARGSRKGTEGEEGEVEALAVAAKRNQVAPEPE